jgi:type III secretion system low calcium response chaperone LcrH/SycD
MTHDLNSTHPNLLNSIKQESLLLLLQEGLLSKNSFCYDAVQIKKIYATSYQLYASGKFQEAQALFSLLMLLEPNEFNFVFGWANCCFMLKDYEKAAEGYIRSGILDLTTPLPYFYAADCYLKNEEFVSASIALKVAFNRCQNKPEYAEIAQRSQLTLKTLMPKSK